MLEQDVLLIHARSRQPRRGILDPDSGAPLGFAGPPPPNGRWWGRPHLPAHEHEDAPLVFTLHRCWSLLPWYEVRDADDRLLGFVLYGVMRDRWRRRVAARQAGRGGGWHYRAPSGRALAHVEPADAGLRLSFT